jgi:hypothetical protein
MLDSGQSSLESLDYARRDAELLPRSRIFINKDADTLRFVDPPLSGPPPRRFLVQVAFEAGLTVTIIVPICVVAHFSLAISIIFTAAIAAAKLCPLLRWWHDAKRHPTLIEITASTFVLSPAGRSSVVIPFTLVADVRASRPWRIPGLQGRMSSLLIRAGRREIRLLRYRDYIEVRWVARQIRTAIGIAKEHSLEPALKKLVDKQEGDFEQSSLQNLPATITSQNKTISVGKLERLRRFIDREYNDLDILGSLFLISSLVAGLVTIGKACDAIVICVQFGSDVYFRDGVRHIPHRGFFKLTNGKEISLQNQVLFYCLAGAGIILWEGVALIVAIGTKKLFAALSHLRARSSVASASALTQRAQRWGPMPGRWSGRDD